MSQVKIGVLGCSEFAQRAILPTIGMMPQCKLVAIASRTFEKAKMAALPFGCKPVEGYKNLLAEDIDLVYIPLPNSLHSEWIEKSLNADKHVWVEKSLATNFEDVVRLNRYAESKGKLLIENFLFRFHKQHQIVKKLISDGELGEIRCFRSSFGFPPFVDQNNIRYQAQLGGGSLLDAGAYTLKATTFMLGMGFGVRSSQLMYDQLRGIDLWGSAFLTNKDGLVSQVSFGFDNFYQCDYEIWGSKGKIVVERAFTAKPGFIPTAIFEQQGVNKTIQLPEDNQYKNMLEYIISLINGAKHNEYEQNIEQARLIDELKKIALAIHPTK